MSEALSSILPQQPWKMTDGSFVSCVEKLKILNQNYEEIRQQCLDAYEDAILMGCDPEQFLSLLHDLVASLETPYRKVTPSSVNRS